MMSSDRITLKIGPPLLFSFPGEVRGFYLVSAFLHQVFFNSIVSAHTSGSVVYGLVILLSSHSHSVERTLESEFSVYVAEAATSPH